MKVDRRYSRADLNSYGVGVYASGRVGAWRPTFGATYGRHRVKSSRRIPRTELAQSLRANYSLDSLQVFGEVGCEVTVNDSFSVMPYAGLSWNGVRNGGYRESGGTAALRVRGHSSSNVFSDLGIRGEYRIGTRVWVTADVAWEHMFGELNKTLTSSFQGGRAFSAKGASGGRDAARATVAGQMDFESGLGMEVGYSGRIAEKEIDHSGQFMMKFTF